MKQNSNGPLFIIRALEFRDLNTLNDLFQNLSETDTKFFHPHSFNLKTLHEILNSNKDHYFVMELNKKIIGYSFLRLFSYEIPSFGCCIFNGDKNKGYGTILTSWTVKRAKKLGYNNVILKTYKKNIYALKIYRKIGFKIIGETEDKKQYRMKIDL